QAQHRVPAREDHQRHGGDALSRGEAFVPAAGIEQRQERAADAGEEATDHGGAQPDQKHRMAHRTRRVRALAGGADQQAPARGPECPVQQRRDRDADQEQHVDAQRRAELRDVAPPAEIDRRQPCRGRLDQWLAEEERESGAEQHQRDADRDVVDARQRADPGMQRAEQRAGDAGREHAEPWRAGEIGDAIGAQRAHHQRALETEIDAAGSLGDALAEADEQKRRRDADGAAEHSERDGPEPERCVRHVRTFPSGSRSVRKARRSPVRTRR
ncbi:hypothetical protein chiPu_0029690, partial [Chiloscyllium punctatum]|nr:hypothetical protein [Chiloscyllium punctatum]